ncbi:hypothetical protein BGW36DRAFT_382184 [Talaromyces proteolyticus]|uniref:Uncharacterized protein n=1 Tax=Talaromyces proteolyticus TaxID=1131652 RepID=A0AAD4KP40_9EURO|nr:uncharacterized protein BGW36DRAFT_382184 [Talaromyces proteolyticus]KAH8695138.1 hypothetical protein BGW36DRAFT_382184 [Talaromyces proteolyticus]
MADTETLLAILRTRRVNTLTELRRIERILVPVNQNTISSEVIEPLTNAWLHYVHSNNLLSELRNLTRSYPFSSELLDEAKMMVTADPESGRSWSFAWLGLKKIESKGLVEKYAGALARNPDMWGGKLPSDDKIAMLEEKCKEEWTRAVRQMLRHWETDPVIA